MSTKRFFVGLAVSAVSYFLYFFILAKIGCRESTNPYACSTYPDLVFNIIYLVFAIIFSAIVGVWGKNNGKSINTGDHVIPFDKFAYLSLCAVFIAWSLILLALMGTRQPPAWMTVIPAGIIFFILYVIGYRKGRFNRFIKTSFVMNYVYLLVTSLFMISESSGDGGMGLGLAWVFFILPLTYLCILIALIYAIIGLARSE